MRRGRRLLNVPGPECVRGRGESARRGRTRSAPVHRPFPVELWRRLGAGEHTPSGGAKLRDLLAASPENRDLPLNEEPFKTALDVAEFLDGFPRYPKMHPCGVVLSRQPMHELTPTFISNKGYPTTHFDMDAVEVIGLVKIDVLAQGGLAVMRDTKAALAQRGVQRGFEGA